MNKAKERWLTQRRSGIGGSDAPIVLGISPFATPLDLWATKLGLVPDQEPGRAAIMGHRLERIVAAEFRERHRDYRVTNPGKYAIVRHPDHACLFATLDRQVERDGEPMALEIKTTADRFGDQWEDGAPMHVQAQLQHQLNVTGWKAGIVAVLIGGRDYREFEYQRDEELISLLTKAELAFWDHVLSETQPTVEASPELARSIARLHPKDNGQTIELPPSLVGVDARLCGVKAQMKALEDERKKLEAEIQCAIGENTFGTLPGVVYSWKHCERKGYEVKPTSFRQLTRKET